MANLYLSEITTVSNLWTICLCFLVFVCVSLYFRSSGNIPPGPISWPLIGNLPIFVLSSWRKELVHDMMTRLSRTYGRIFSLSFGGSTRVIVLNEMSAIREAFQKPELSDRITSPLLEQVCKGRGVLISSGAVWKHQRRFSLSVFRSFGVGKKSFDEEIATEASYLCDEISRQFIDGLFDPRKLLMNATSNMICSILLGKRFECTDAEFRNLLSMLDERIKLIGGGALQAQVPLLRMLNPKRGEALVKNVRQIVAYFADVVQDHKNVLQETGEYKDLTDLYLKEVEQCRKDPEMAQTVNEDHLISFADNLFLAGTETSSNTLAWCLLHLIAKPEVQRKIRQEIQDVCTGSRGRLPKYSDREDMPFTEAVILETQRLHTVVPMGVPHYTHTATVLSGFTIPEHSIVLANLWAVHHDPDIWGDPEVFRPSRFLDEKGNVSHKEEWIPFSIGRRVCLGERLAKMEIFIFLTHLVTNFSFKKPNDVTDISFDGQDGATYGPMPYKIIAERIR